MKKSNVVVRGLQVILTIVQNPIIGRASGKLANAIFSKNYQKNIIRSKPIEVIDANSDAQKAQRHDFTVIQDAVSQCLTLVRMGFRGYTQKMSAFAMAMKKNLPEAVSTPGISSKVDPTKFELGDGNLAEFSGFEVGAADSAELTITWLDTRNTQPVNASDKVSFVVMSALGVIKGVFPNAAARSETSYIAILSEGTYVDGDYLLTLFTSTANKAGADLSNKVKRSVIATV